MSKKSIEQIEELLGELQRPSAVVDAQNDIEYSDIRGKEQDYPRVNLFFSFDIVNSTMYKSFTGNWLAIIRGLLEEIRTRVFKMQELTSCNLWRVIGDEMIFVMPVYDMDALGEIVDSIFEVTQKISISLKNGDFFETIVGQEIQKHDIDMLKVQTPLSIKAASWIAIINDKVQSPYECVKFNYSASPQNQIITEYLGKDMDAGFRLKSYTQDRRLAVSFELAYLLLKNDRADELFIMDYVQLKGVWNNVLYPVIWFHNARILKASYQDRTDDESKFSF